MQAPHFNGASLLELEVITGGNARNEKEASGMMTCAVTLLPVFLRRLPTGPSVLPLYTEWHLGSQLISAEILSRTRFAERSEPSMNPW
jgi:hypothetical protein